MSSARTAGLPPRARQLLDVLYDAVLEEPALRAAVDRERWIETVRAEYKAWRTAISGEKCGGISGENSGGPGRESSENRDKADGARSVAVADGPGELEAKVEARHDAEHAIARLALETLAEQALLAQSAVQDVRPRLPKDRIAGLLADIDSVDLEMYRRCELELERASAVARAGGVPRDEVLRRWSRTRQALLDRVREA
jgi:hypothetical protein